MVRLDLGGTTDELLDLSNNIRSAPAHGVVNDGGGQRVALIASIELRR